MDRALAPRNLCHDPAPVSPAAYDWLSTLMLRLTRLTPHLVTGHRTIGRCRGQAPGNWCRCSTLYFAPGLKTLLIRHQPSCNEPLGYQSWQCFTRSVFIYGSEKIAFQKLIDGLKFTFIWFVEGSLGHGVSWFFESITTCDSLRSGHLQCQDAWYLSSCS